MEARDPADRELLEGGFAEVVLEIGRGVCAEPAGCIYEIHADRPVFRPRPVPGEIRMIRTVVAGNLEEEDEEEEEDEDGE